MTRGNPIGGFIFLLLLAIGSASAFSAYHSGAVTLSVWLVIVTVLVAGGAYSAVDVAQQWDRAVIHRFGRYRRLQGPGLFFILPFIESIPSWIDTRLITTSVSTDATLTKDTIPVDVDAVLSWKVVDPQKAAMSLSDYKDAMSRAFQSALNDLIANTMLSDILEGRDKICSILRKIIDERTEPWGINVQSVEVKDVSL